MAKLTANQREFEKQIRRINRLINKVEAEGLVFIKPPIEPVKPKRISKSRLEKLQSISLPSLRAKAYEIDETTGEVIPYKDPQYPRRRKKPEPFYPSKRGISLQKPPLSEEQLHRVRQEAGRKAQETIKRRMAEDPAYAKRITEARRKALKTARDKMKKRMAEDPEYAQHMKDIWYRNLHGAGAVGGKGARNWTEEEKRTFRDIFEPLKPQTPEEQKKQEIEEQEKAPDYQPANATDTILDNMYEILRGAVNKHVADVLIRVADDQAEEEGRDALAKRLATGNDHYWVLDLATKIAFYESDKQEEIKQSAYTLAYILTQGNVGQFTEDEIISAVNMDFGGYYQ